MKPEDIDTSAPLFQDGLGLDSIDALELGIAIQRAYGLKLDAEDSATRDHFYSIDTLAKFVAASA
jgi:acyl carrier protein